MLRTVSCVVAECDECGAVFGEHGDVIPHFTSEQQALEQITGDDEDEQSWTVLASGKHRCDGCATKRLCAEQGHDYPDWRRCLCDGHIAGHGQTPAGDCTLALRTCDRCWHSEQTPLANTDVPDIVHRVVLEARKAMAQIERFAGAPAPGLRRRVTEALESAARRGKGEQAQREAVMAVLTPHLPPQQVTYQVEFTDPAHRPFAMAVESDMDNYDLSLYLAGAIRLCLERTGASGELEVVFDDRHSGTVLTSAGAELARFHASHVPATTA